MKIELNCNERVFQIVTSTETQVFCNLKDIAKVLNELQAIDDYCKIYHFWDCKPKRLSQKALNQMLDAASICKKNTVFSINIEALEWFDKANGNSFHAGEVIVNSGQVSEQTLKFGLTYGYGMQYYETAIKMLVRAGLLPALGITQMYDFLKNNSITVNYKIKTGCNKSELMQFKNN
jgi:hypothetical protein